MPDNYNHDGYGYYQDITGKPYTTYDGKPMETPGTVYNVPDGKGGFTTGILSGGIVTPDKT